MKDMEKIIRENKESFDSFEPNNGHFERFASKLKKYNKKKKIILIPNMLKIAAVIVLVLLSSLWLYDNIFSPEHPEKGIALGEISPEYEEVEFYFNTLIDAKYRELEHFDFVDDSTQKKMLLKELSEMDSIYNNLKEDLRLNPTDERIIHAMIEHYQLKVEVMNKILNQLYKINKLKKEIDHESTEI